MTSQYIASAVAVLQKRAENLAVPICMGLSKSCNGIYEKEKAKKDCLVELKEAQIFLDALGFLPNLEQAEKAMEKSFEELLAGILCDKIIVELIKDDTLKLSVLQGFDLSGFFNSMRKTQYYYNEYKNAC